MKRRSWQAGILLALALLGFAAAIAIRVSRRVLATLHPPRIAVGSPVGLNSVFNVKLTTSDGVAIRGWYAPSRNTAAVILGHGWGGQRASLLREARALADNGYGVLLFDWRAHGESGGSRTTWGVDEQRDLEAALDFLTSRADVDPTRIGAFGFSMGGMIIAQVATRDPRLRAVVLEGTFSSLEDELRHDEGRWGWWSGTVAVWTLRRAGVLLDRERPIDALCRISPRPLLVIVGTADRDLPVPVARRMYRAACEPKSLWIIPGATHHSYDERGGTDRERRLVDFFEHGLLTPALAQSRARSL